MEQDCDGAKHTMVDKLEITDGLQTSKDEKDANGNEIVDLPRIQKAVAVAA